MLIHLPVNSRKVFVPMSTDLASWWRGTLERLADLSNGSAASVLLRIFLVGCSLFVMVQWFALWGTRWGDHGSLAKSFSLSLLIHLCLGLGWVSVVQFRSMPGDSVAAGEPIVIRQVFIDEADLPTESSLNPAGGLQVDLDLFKPERSRSQPADAVYEVASIPRAEPVSPSNRQLDVNPLPVPSRAETTEPVRRAAAVEALPVPVPDATSLPEERAGAEARDESRPTSFSRRTIASVSESPSTELTEPTRLPNELRRRSADVSAIDPRARELPAPRLPTDDLSIPDLRTGMPRGSSSFPKQAMAPPAAASGARDPLAKNSGSDGTLRGRVRDAKSGQPLAGTVIRVDLADGRPVLTRTNDDGTYELSLPKVPDNVAVSAARAGYLPESKNLRVFRGDGNIHRLDFELGVNTERVIAIESTPVIHHLGNDKFEGSVNSQFQRPSEGILFRADFDVAGDQYPDRASVAVVTFLAKGIQCEPQVRLNGHLLTDGLAPSPTDGSFGPVIVAFEPAWLRVGRNVITITAVVCANDLDDFEFVNLQVRLSP